MLNRELVHVVYRSRTLGRVALMALATGAYAALAVWKENSKYNAVADTPAELHTALSLVLGLLLVFRTNATYNRWWEARTLWGAIVTHFMVRVNQNLQ